MQLTLLDILGLDILTIRHSGVRHFDIRYSGNNSNISPSIHFELYRDEIRSHFLKNRACNSNGVDIKLSC